MDIKHFEETINSQTVYEGAIINVTRDTVRLENGESATRDVVHHNGGAAVIAIDSDNNIALVRQYRYPMRGEMLEIPAGKLEKGEDPFLAAKRELREETGLAASEYLDLGFIVPTCGYCDEKIYIYAARGLQLHEQCLDDDEFVSVIHLPLGEAVELCLKNEITDSKTVAAILKLHLLRAENKF